LLSAVGVIAFTRRYWKCRCGATGAYAADALLGIEGERFSKVVQKHACRLGADNSFAATSEHLHELLGIDLCPETVRTMVEGHGRALARFQTRDQQSARAFVKAEGEVEFAVDAGKVNTREEGWKDLKIAVVSKREAGKPTAPETPAAWDENRLPRATMSLAFATIATAHDFRRLWRPWLRRLGVSYFVDVHALGDGAGWIWKAVQRCLTGCTQTLDFFHACQYLNQCAEAIFGDDTPEKDDAFKDGRALLAQQGWQGVCCWIGQLLSIDDDQERERRRRATEKVIKYFVAHLKRLNYAECLQNGRAIGSGMVEGRAKTLGLRLKLRGARWNQNNVTPMASLVCVRQTCEWNAYWTTAA
jgi:hypothetical protein